MDLPAGGPATPAMSGSGQPDLAALELMGPGNVMGFGLDGLRLALVVVAVAAVVAGLTVMLLARPVLASTDALREATRHLGDPSYRPVPNPPTAPLAGLASELTDAHQRLTEGRARERAVERSRRELIAYVSHDLRTPLAGIRAMAEALDDRVVDDPAEVARYHAQLRLDAEQLAGMLEDLYELARVPAGGPARSPSRVPPADLVSDAVAAADPLVVADPLVADPLARAKGVRLRTRWPVLTGLVAKSPRGYRRGGAAGAGQARSGAVANSATPRAKSTAGR